jgi:hypothetical protein
MPKSTTSIASWNRSTQHVETTTRAGRYVNAETTLIFAGPPRLEDVGTISRAATQNTTFGESASNGKDAFYPIGLLESATVQQIQNVQKLYEIGSRRSYQAGGRVQVVGSLGRILSNGPSLMRALYAYYPNTVQLAGGKVLGTTGVTDSVMSTIVGAGTPGGGSSTGKSPIFPPIFFPPGALGGTDPENNNSRNVAYLNLMSELFSHPFGYGFLFRDNANNNYSGFYLEDCFITAHSFQVGSASTLISEAVHIQADAAVPVEYSTDVGARINDAFGLPTNG